MNLRVRTLAAIGGVALVIGGGIWLFASGSNEHTVGAGGLPLIKADLNPVKLPPEDPGGEIMPNADSTVFTAMGEAQVDPSMQNLKLPEVATPEEPAQTSEFAGLRTGFALPVAPEKKTESLFSSEEKQAVQPAAEETPAPEPVQEDAAPPPEPVIEPVVEPIVPAIPQPDTSTAQAMEAREIEAAEEAAPPTKAEAQDTIDEMDTAIKGIVARPTVKPTPPIVAKTPTPKLEPKLESVAAAAPKPAPAVQTAPVKTTPIPQTPAPSGHYIQLASMPEGGDAAALWGRLMAQYPGALAGLRPVYQTAEVPGKGSYTRIQAGPMTSQEARDRCARLQTVNPKGGCLVLRK